MGTSIRVPNVHREDEDPFKDLATGSLKPAPEVDPFRDLASKEVLEAEDVLNEKPAPVRFAAPPTLTARATQALAAYRDKAPIRRDVLPPRREDDRTAPIDEIVKNVAELNPTDAPPPTTFAGKVADAAGRMAAHPVETAKGLALAPITAAHTLGEFTRQEIEKGDAARRGEVQDGPGIVTPGEDVVSGKEAAAAAAQLVAIGGAGMTEAALERALLRRGFNEHLAVIAAKGAVGAGVGATFTPDQPGVGAVIGGLLGAAHPKTVRRPIGETDGANLADHPDRLLPRGNRPGATATVTRPEGPVDPFSDMGPDYEVTAEKGPTQPPVAPTQEPVRSTRPRDYTPSSVALRSPEQEHVRDIANRLKSADVDAITEAADEMAQRLPANTILVPIPDHTGSSRANRALADAIAGRTGAPVFDVLARTTPVESSTDRRRAGGVGLTADEHAASLSVTGQLPLDKRIVLVDNVETTGATAEGARRALGRDADLIVYAQAPVPPGEAPASITKPNGGQPQPVVVTPREVPHIAGDQEVVSLSDGRDLQVEYAIIDADDLIASHHPLTFQPRPDYPAGVQGRAYHDQRGKAAREAVAQQTAGLRPGVLLDLGSGAENGPPVVTPDGYAVVGNQRLMMLQRAPTLAPEKYQAYRDELARRAYKFGFTPDAFAEMKRPVLVRRLIDPSVNTRDPVELAELNRISDTPAAKAKDVLSEAATRANALQQAPQALAHFSRTFDPETTLRDYMNTADGQSFAKQLVAEGVIQPQETGRFIAPSGHLTEPGSQLVQGMMRLAAVPNVDIIQRAPPSMLRQLDGALPSIALTNTIPGYELGEIVGKALEIGASARAHNLDIDTFLRQRDIFAPEESKHIARYIEDASKQRTTEAFRKYAVLATEARASGDSIDAFGWKPDERIDMLAKLFAAPADGVRESAKPYNVDEDLARLKQRMAAGEEPTMQLMPGRDVAYVFQLEEIRQLTDMTAEEWWNALDKKKRGRLLDDHGFGPGWNRSITGFIKGHDVRRFAEKMFEEYRAELFSTLPKNPLAPSYSAPQFPATAEEWWGTLDRNAKHHALISARLSLDYADMPARVLFKPNAMDTAGKLTQQYEKAKTSVGERRKTYQARDPKQIQIDLFGPGKEDLFRDGENDTPNEQKKIVAAVSSAEKALFDYQAVPMPGASGYETLDTSLAHDYAQKVLKEVKAIDLIGQKVATLADEAAVLMMTRNPYYETLRIGFVKGDVIASHTAVSARLAGSAQVWPGATTPEVFEGSPITFWIGWSRRDPTASI
jgi:hypothetical protein